VYLGVFECFGWVLGAKETTNDFIMCVLCVNTGVCECVFERYLWRDSKIPSLDARDQINLSINWKS
jgi:hypothetical protein